MKYLFFLVLILSSLCIQAENYTLEQLLNYALENNTTLQQSGINLQIAHERRTSAKINYLPDLSAGAGRTEDFVASDANNFMYFDISKSISLNNESYFLNRYAQHDLNLSNLSNQIQLQDIIYRIIQDYISVLENQKRLDLYEENIRIQESIVFESNQLFRQNRITPFEVQQSEINLLNAKINALNSRNNLTNSRNRLFDLINITDEGYELAEVRIYENENVADFAREIDFNTILQVQQQNETAARQRTSINQTKLDFYPQLSLNYNLNRNLSSSDFDFDNGRTNHTLGLRITYSLNRFMRNRYSYKVANLLDEHNDLSTSRLISDITLRYNQYREELNYLLQLHELQEIRVQQTTDNLEIAQQRYRLGLLTQLDLDRARYDYLNSRIDLEVNMYQLILKRLSIDHLLSNMRLP